MRYLTAEEVLVLHALVIDEFGGSHGVRDIALLKSIIEKPAARFGGKNLYPTLWNKATVLCESITNYHVFVDGNKRTALISAGRFLALNGYELSASNAEVEKLIFNLGTKKIDVAHTAAWFKKHSRKIKRQIHGHER